MRSRSSGAPTWPGPRRAASAGVRASASTASKPWGRPSRSPVRSRRRRRASTSFETRRSPASPSPTCARRGRLRSGRRRGQAGLRRRSSIAMRASSRAGRSPCSAGATPSPIARLADLGGSAGARVDGPGRPTPGGGAGGPTPDVGRRCAAGRVHAPRQGRPRGVRRRLAPGGDRPGGRHGARRRRARARVLRPGLHAVALRAQPRRDADRDRRRTPRHRGRALDHRAGQQDRHAEARPRAGPRAALAWSSRGDRLAIGLRGTSTVEIWDVAERHPIATLEGHAQQVSAARVSTPTAISC